MRSDPVTCVQTRFQLEYLLFYTSFQDFSSTFLYRCSPHISTPVQYSYGQLNPSRSAGARGLGLGRGCPIRAAPLSCKGPVPQEPAVWQCDIGQEASLMRGCMKNGTKEPGRRAGGTRGFAGEPNLFLLIPEDVLSLALKEEQELRLSLAIHCSQRVRKESKEDQNLTEILADE